MSETKNSVLGSTFSGTITGVGKFGNSFGAYVKGKSGQVGMILGPAYANEFGESEFLENVRSKRTVRVLAYAAGRKEGTWNLQMVRFDDDPEVEQSVERVVADYQAGKFESSSSRRETTQQPPQGERQEGAGPGAGPRRQDQRGQRGQRGGKGRNRRGDTRPDNRDRQGAPSGEAKPVTVVSKPAVVVEPAKPEIVQTPAVVVEPPKPEVVQTLAVVVEPAKQPEVFDVSTYEVDALAVALVTVGTMFDTRFLGDFENENLSGCFLEAAGGKNILLFLADQFCTKRKGQSARQACSSCQNRPKVWVIWRDGEMLWVTNDQMRWKAHQKAIEEGQENAKQEAEAGAELDVPVVPAVDGVVEIVQAVPPETA